MTIGLVLLSVCSFAWGAPDTVLSVAGEEVEHLAVGRRMVSPIDGFPLYRIGESLPIGVRLLGRVRAFRTTGRSMTGKIDEDRLARDLVKQARAMKAEAIIAFQSTSYGLSRGQLAVSGIAVKAFAASDTDAIAPASFAVAILPAELSRELAQDPLNAMEIRRCVGEAAQEVLEERGYYAHVLGTAREVFPDSLRQLANTTLPGGVDPWAGLVLALKVEVLARAKSLTISLQQTQMQATLFSRSTGRPIWERVTTEGKFSLGLIGVLTTTKRQTIRSAMRSLMKTLPPSQDE